MVCWINSVFFFEIRGKVALIAIMKNMRYFGNGFFRMLKKLLCVFKLLLTDIPARRYARLIGKGFFCGTFRYSDMLRRTFYIRAVKQKIIYLPFQLRGSWRYIFRFRCYSSRNGKKYFKYYRREHGNIVFIVALHH